MEAAADAQPTWAIIPVKDFLRAKERLAPALDPRSRARLARSMAAHVVAACRPLPVAVVCDSVNVREWAVGVGARVVWTPGLGLNGAVGAGVDWVTGQGAKQVLVVHADLPFARDLGDLVCGEPDPTRVVLVPDRHDDGTNALVIPTSRGFRFAYGSGSFQRHRTEAGRLDLRVEVVRSESLAWDVDLPADLAGSAALGEVIVP